MPRYLSAIAIAIFASLILAFTNCDNNSIVRKPPVVQSSSVVGEICTLRPDALRSATKVIFMIDESGSNRNTDRQKAFRRGLVNAFQDKFGSGPSLFWAMIGFGAVDGTDGAHAIINDGDATVATFSNDVAKVSAAIDQFVTVDQDTGGTPYHAAIDMAIRAIQADRATATGSRSTYVAVLISDGVPTDAAYGSPLDQVKINADARRFPAEGATLSTVYYGPQNVEPSSRLREMAGAGGGKFSDVNQDGEVPIEQIIGVAYSEPWILKRFGVANLNAAPCEDSTMDADSDADGICDKDEIKFNKLWPNDPTYTTFNGRMDGKLFDPINRNSFSPVFNDLAYFKHITQGDYIDLSCTDKSDADADLLNKCEEQFLKSNHNSGPSPTWSSLMGSDADPDNFDSDGDGIPDWLEFVFERTNGAVLNYTSTTRLIDGLRMDEIIGQYRNPRKPNSGNPYDGELHFSRINGEGQSCYTYTQSVLPLYDTKKVTTAQVSGRRELSHADSESVILIYFIQTPQSDPNGTGEMRYLYQKLRPSSGPLKLNLSVDQYNIYSADNARSRNK